MTKTALKWIAYFDVFNHPLTEKEIEQLSVEPSEVKPALENGLNSQLCFEYNGYYSIQKSVQELVEKRLQKEKEASKYLKKLPAYAKLIRKFPFVKGVAISGSLSKNVMYDDGDIDYFIITSKDRLWICRTALILFKKVFLLNSRKYFCVNYFVDEDNLKILDENIFTAVEINYLTPVFNKEIFEQLKTTNQWSSEFIQNFTTPLQLKDQPNKGWIKKPIESLLKGKLGDRLDLYFMQQTYGRWKNKFKDFNPDKFDLTMRSNRGVSKHHPRDFQNRVLAEYKKRLDQLNITE